MTQILCMVLPLGSSFRKNLKAGWASKEEQVSKQHSFMVASLVDFCPNFPLEGMSPVGIQEIFPFLPKLFYCSSKTLKDMTFTFL